MAQKKAPVKAQKAVEPIQDSVPEPVVGKPFVRKPRTDQYVYDKVKALHDEVNEEMRRRQLAGERWRALHPVIQRLFIILQGLRIFVTVPKG